MKTFMPTTEQLTAYALDECPASELAAMTAFLATNSQATDDVAAIRETAALLRAAFQSGAQPTLGSARRAALAHLEKIVTARPASHPTAPLSASAQSSAPAVRVRFPHRIVWPAALAAALVIGVALPHHQTENGSAASRTFISDERSNSQFLPVAAAQPAAPSKAERAEIEGPMAELMAAPMKLNTPSEEQEAAAVSNTVDRTQPQATRREEALATDSGGLGEFMAIGCGGGFGGGSKSRPEAETPAAPTVASRAAGSENAGIKSRTTSGGLFGSPSGGGIPARLREEKYPVFVENGWHRVTAEADDLNRRSTLGADVDTASYSNVRRMLNDGHLPPSDAVRLEEMLNAMPYSYRAPATRSTPFALYPEVGPAPWDPTHRLVRIALRGYELDAASRPPANLVFLIDVSGSMNQPNKLPLVQRALSLLTEQLRDDDRVAIVTYAGNTGIRLASTAGDNRSQILQAIASLSAAGGTNGAGGIITAYDVAKRGFIEHGVNRVVLCTDGDFNVGINSRDGLERLIADEAKSNVFLTVLGFGMGNYQDSTLQVLADKGNGQYAYIDSEAEARKQLVDGCTGMLVTIAKDVKIQVEFNPATVSEWRLLGYEKRHLRQQDFLDDTKDGGEIGAGHALTAFYEIVPRRASDQRVPPLRYASEDGQAASREEDALPDEPLPDEPARNELAINEPGHDELLTVSLRWKLPEGDRSTGLSLPIADHLYARPSADFAFATAVIEFAQVLRHTNGSWSLDRSLSTAQATAGTQPQRREFIDLVRKAQQLGAR